MHTVPNGVCAFRLTTAAAEKRISCVLCAYKNLVHFPLADKEADVWFVHTGQRIVYQPAKNWVSRPVSQSVSSVCVCAFIKVQIRKYTRTAFISRCCCVVFLPRRAYRRLSFFYLFYSLLFAALHIINESLSRRRRVRDDSSFLSQSRDESVSVTPLIIQWSLRRRHVLDGRWASQGNSRRSNHHRGELLYGDEPWTRNAHVLGGNSYLTILNTMYWN
jgi:hypothetical protein